ncbi:MAG: hypothetical protein JSV84_17295 [Gemmatimonadota bacterium]|nr:MAG: hypothetical protein JSV84_17295 [Gemmatimonadota bacterium]
MKFSFHLFWIQRDKAAMTRSMAAFVLSLSLSCALSGPVGAARRMVLGELFTNTS